jgi:tuberous sclerosis 2
VNVFQPIESPTPLLRSITTLLSREFAPSEKHLLAEILIDACEHVTDDNTARIPGLLGEDYGLMPMASSWIENWKRILIPRLLSVNRPQTRAAIIATLKEAYSAIQETPSYRAELIKLIIDNRDDLIAIEGSEPIFSILEDEVVIEVSERDEEQPDSNIIPSSIQLLISLVDADESPEPVAHLAVQTLITIFSELSFTALSLQENNRKLSLIIFDTLLRLLSHMHDPQPRLLALQFLVRLRADRDHRVYFALESYDANESVAYLASLINRLPDSLMRAHKDEILEEHVARNKSTRTRIAPSRATTGFAPGELPGQGLETLADTREHTILWQLPEALPFRVVEPDSIKTSLRSFDGDFILPVSRYIAALTSLIRTEHSWELVSYILCHLPVQLSNKHLFCGPNTRQAILELLLLLSKGVIDGSLASQTAEDCPENLKIRDLQGLAHHTLSTLISYKASFDLQQRHLLIEAFYAGLNGPFSTIKCCLHALSLAAFEASPSLSKCLPRILEKLAQIMSNPNMAVHILTFLAMVSSVPSLHASFTEDDFKMVFGVALQYLQHYNQLRNSPTRSWALSQHVRQQSYVTVYSWFTVLRITDRPAHIPYVTRQLLLANEGREVLDGATEVCFDWLARNTHGCANSEKRVAHDIILQPNIAKPATLGPSKTWLYGNSFLTVKALDRKGWVEALSRRPSGSAGIVCRSEDLVRIGVDRVPPDLRACLLDDLLEAPPEASHNIELVRVRSYQ